MNGGLSDDQKTFADSLDRLLTDALPFARRQAAVATPGGFDGDLWQQLADLGCMAAAFPEELGGLGGGPEELMIIGEKFGRHLVTGPFLASVVLGGHAVLFAGSDAWKADVLPGVARGTTKLALAWVERQARHDLHDVATRVRPMNGGWVLSGRKDVVPGGAQADVIVVSARVSGERRDRDGIILVAVPADASGVVRLDERAHDGNRVSTVLLDGVEIDDAQFLTAPDQGLAVLERVIDHAIAFVCADAAGSMWQVFETTLEYLKTRRQFDRTLGSFQALQHRMVDLYIDCELAWSMVLDTTQALTTPQRRHAVSSAKVAVGESARRVAEEGVQLHGGIGMTMDVPVGHHLKRAVVMNATFGDVDHHLGLLASSPVSRESSHV